MSALIRYQVSARTPHDHLLHVRLELDGLADDEHVDLSMPVWSPGSYLVREYARHVQNVRAFDADGERRQARKIDKATWRVDVTQCNSVRVVYEVYAYDLNVRANYFDDTQAFIHGVATFMYPHGREDEAVEVQLVPPEDKDWGVSTGLDLVDGPSKTFAAPDFDTLFDCPVHLGDHDNVPIVVDDVDHQLVFPGKTNYDRDELGRDVARVIRANRDVFGELPYERYSFITLLSDGAGGGLEHRNSSALIWPRDGFTRGDKPGSPDDSYVNFLSLVCHEHFHVWNVKRIRPANLGPFDYQNENYTRDLWTVEGITSYYDTLGLVRAGIIDANGYATRLLKRIHQYDRVPGRKLHSLEDASFDAWIKLYRPDENTRNSTVSYYLKGEIVCALLDLHLRQQTGGEACLDDVLRHLWEHYYVAGDTGYPEGSYERIVTEVTGVDVGEFFDAYIRGTDDFDWDALLAPVGLELTRESSVPQKAWLGASTETREGRVRVLHVPTDSPAQRGGIWAGDEIVAVDGWKVTGDNLAKRIADHAPGDSIEMHLFRRGELRQVSVELGLKPQDKYSLRTRDDADEAARDLLRGWLGSDEIEAEYTG